MLILGKVIRTLNSRPKLVTNVINIGGDKK